MKLYKSINFSCWLKQLQYTNILDANYILCSFSKLN